MYSQTTAVLEKYDNDHEFERMCADILNALGFRDVVPIAPRGGNDGGKDITFTTENGGKGLACVTLRKDIEKKYYEDFSQRQPGEFEKYMLFCTAHLTAQRKREFIGYCLDTLQAEFVPYDIEALRSLLDSVLQPIRETYLGIIDQEKLRRKEIEHHVNNQVAAHNLFNEAKQAVANYYWEGAEALIEEALQLYDIAEAPSFLGLQMSAALKDTFQRLHDIPPGYNAAELYEELDRLRTGKPHLVPPKVTQAISWLERAGKQNMDSLEKNAVAEVLAALALTYGLSKNYDAMMGCMKEAIEYDPTPMRASFKNPVHLAILVHGCAEEPKPLEALQKLGDALKITLPVPLLIIQQSISASDQAVYWVVMGQPLAWVGRTPPNFPTLVWMKAHDEEGIRVGQAGYRTPDNPGVQTTIPPDRMETALDQLFKQLDDQFLFICHIPLKSPYSS